MRSHPLWRRVLQTLRPAGLASLSLVSLVWLLLLVVGCATSVKKEQLEAAPMAIVYRTFAERELILDKESQADPRINAIKRMRGTMDLKAVESYLGLVTRQDVDRALVGRLMLLDPVGSEPRDPGFRTRGARPLAWSPGHERLLYLAKGRSGPQIYEWNRKTSAIRRISYDDGRYLGAAYGPDGAIAFSRVEPLSVEGEAMKSVVGGARILVRTPESGRVVPLTPGPLDIEPTWSPTGGAIVYEGRRADGSQEIRSVDPAEPGHVKVLARGRAPAYSADGQWIVYSAPVRGNWSLWRMHADGTGRRPFGAGPFEEDSPSFSPDGGLVVYVGLAESTDKDTQLMIRPLDGGGDVPIKLDGDGLYPVW